MILKITPTLPNGQTGKPQVEETESMSVALKQASHYIKGNSVFKFFVVTKINGNEERN